MNPIKHFFQVDLPATFSVGKSRIAVMQLKSQLTQLQKQREPIINELGVKAWDGRVKDISYEKTYGKLEELDTTGGQVQNEIDETQNLIQQENTSLNTITEEFNTRVKEIQDQRQPAMRELGELQTQQRGIETQLKDLQTKIEQATSNIRNMELQASQLSLSTQPDKETNSASLKSTVETLKRQINEANGQVGSVREELETNQGAQTPIKDQVEGYNQLIKMEQEKIKSTSDPIQKKIAALQQNISKLREKKNGLIQRILVFLTWARKFPNIVPLMIY
jgi:chromosome segregation ATPase